jgi:hypothetical protein
MKIFKILIAVLSLTSFSAQAGRSIQHEVQADETAWFISQVYYGSGLKYVDILKANKLQSPEQIRKGMLVKIPDPRFEQSQPNFKTRYERLADQRDQKLKTQKSEVQKTSDSGSLPVGYRPQKTKLPFAKADRSGKSAAELAKEELKTPLRTGEVHE